MRHRKIDRRSILIGNAIADKHAGDRSVVVVAKCALVKIDFSGIAGRERVNDYASRVIFPDAASLLLLRLAERYFHAGRQSEINVKNQFTRAMRIKRKR